MRGTCGNVVCGGRRGSGEREKWNKKCIYINMGSTGSGCGVWVLEGGRRMGKGKINGGRPTVGGKKKQEMRWWWYWEWGGMGGERKRGGVGGGEKGERREKIIIIIK